MLNNFSVMGRLTSTPEIKITSNNKKVCNFTIANEEYSKEQRITSFIDCVAWEHNADFLNTYFSKGDSILLTGSVRTRSFKDKKQNLRKVTELIVQTINFAGANSKNAEEGKVEMPDPIEE